MEQSRCLTKTFITKTPFRADGNHDHNGFEISVSYVKAGYSYWDYHRYPSGYRISFTPIKIEKCGNYYTRSFMAGEGFYAQAEEAERFNRKKLNAIFAETLANLPAWLERHKAGTLNEIGYAEAE